MLLIGELASKDVTFRYNAICYHVIFVSPEFIKVNADWWTAWYAKMLISGMM